MKALRSHVGEGAVTSEPWGTEDQGKDLGPAQLCFLPRRAPNTQYVLRKYLWTKGWTEHGYLYRNGKE